MPATATRNNLGDWQNAPVVQDQVISYMDQIGAPMLLREIYYPLRLPRYTVNRVLARLHAKGFLTRYQIPVRSHRWDLASQSILSEGATRHCYLYALAEGYDE